MRQRERPAGPPRLLDVRLLRKLLRELKTAPRPLKVSLNWGDEPLLNPRFLELAALCRREVPDVTWLLQTNGDLLDRRTAARLSRLFDAVAVNVYSEADHLRLAALGLDRHAPSRQGRLLHAGRLGARPGRAVFHVNAKYLDDDWVERNDEARLGRRVPCHRLWLQAAVAASGDVHLCCRDSHRWHPVGNLARQTLSEAFNSPEAQALRASMQAGRRDRIAMCRRCEGRLRAPFEGRGDELPEGASQMPWGAHDYLSARSLARQLGHVALPGRLPLRYERVVGLDPRLARAIVRALRSELGEALLAVWVTGNRVVSRRWLRRLDPSAFAGRGSRGTLEVEGKGRVREFGTDPRASSDLDLKVLVDRRLVGERQARDLGGALGRRLEALGAPFPISGHRPASLRPWRVPRAGPVEAFASYQALRKQELGKGPHSPEQVVLLFDPSRDVLAEDATAPVRAELTADSRERVRLSRLVAPRLSEGAALRARHGSLSGHQLLCALLDFPELEPRGVRVRGGRIVAGKVAVWAALAAGRESVAVEG